MLVSIVTTVYNKADTIGETIESVLNQSEKDLELILINDGSTDNSSIEIAKYEKDKRIVFVNFGENRGCGSALRYGIMISTGKYVGIVDGGDIITKNAVYLMSRALASHPTVSLAYSDYVRRKEDLGTNKDCGKRALPFGCSYLGGLLGESKRVSIIHFKMFKKSFYDKTVWVKEGLRKSVDKELIFLLEEVGELIYVPKNLYHWRRESQSLTRSYSKLSPDKKIKMKEDIDDVITRAKERRLATVDRKSLKSIKINQK